MALSGCPSRDPVPPRVPAPRWERMGPAWTAQRWGRQEVQTRSQTEKPLLPRLLPCRGEASSWEASSCRSVLPEEAPLQAPELLHGPPGDTTRAPLGERRGRVRRQRHGGAERLGG